MKKVVIAGGTGFIGSSLANYLHQEGMQPIIIARNPPATDSAFPFYIWDGRNQGDWVQSLEGAHALVNLAGKSVDCRKTPLNCDLILRSRVESTKALGQALQSVKNGPKVWIQMSTAHMYGDSELPVTEDSIKGYGLAPFVAQAWEQSLLEHIPKDVREVRLRTSFVIGKNGGALRTLVRLAKCGLGGTVGTGKQGISWIHEQDLNRMVLQAITDSNYSGPYILSAPNPVSQRDFMKKLRKQLKMPFGLPSPALLVQMGAYFLLNTDPELALYGRYVIPERLNRQGFTFAFPSLEPALAHLLP